MVAYGRRHESTRPPTRAILDESAQNLDRDGVLHVKAVNEPPRKRPESQFPSPPLARVLG